MPHAPDLSGQVLADRYQLLALIGEGTFGRVYRGHDRRLERMVAVKVIKPWWADDPEFVAGFEREAQLLARVSDPGIVQIFDIGHAPEGLYYVAELVDGESLAERLQRGSPPPQEARRIALGLCRALGRAHAQQVVHRDVKPANVLISGEGRIKVGDFGVARLAALSTPAQAGTIVGTPRYMSPEQARGLPVTPASDVYSVGIVLYEMLAGNPPFSGDSPVDLALLHATEPLPPLPGRVPRALADVVERALAKDPSRRFRDGAKMAEALSAAARLDDTLVAPRMSPRRNVNPAARRRSIAALCAVGMLLVAMIAAAIVLAAPGRVRLPELRGRSRTAILATVHRLSLRPVFSRRYDRARPGLAIAQTPPRGTWVSRGSSVQVVLSQGPPPVDVPQLVGQSSSGARTILSSLGLSARVTAVPAPGVPPGVVTAQIPAPGQYRPVHSRVALSVAETPYWHPVTTFAATKAAAFVPFRIRGTRWRIVYRMAYVGTCTLIIFCDGPSARVVAAKTRSTETQFDLSDGENQTQTVQSGPGLYQVAVTPGSDTARWTMKVEDYY